MRRKIRVNLFLQFSYTRQVLSRLYPVHKLCWSNPSLRYYLYVPGILSFLYMLLVVLAVYVSFDAIADWVTNIVIKWIEFWIPFNWYGFLFLIRVVIYISFCVLWWILTSTSFKFIILSLTRIWTKPLAAKVRSLVLHNITSSPPSSPFSLQKWKTGIKVSLKHIIEELIFIALIWIIGFVLPGFGILTIFISSYYTGIQLLWFMIEKMGDYDDQKEYCRNHWGLMMAVGLVFYGLLAFPVVGWIFAVPYATISGCLVLFELEKAKQC